MTSPKKEPKFYVTCRTKLNYGALAEGGQVTYDRFAHRVVDRPADWISFFMDAVLTAALNTHETEEPGSVEIAVSIERSL